jgi:hypothetical protein
MSALRVQEQTPGLSPTDHRFQHPAHPPLLLGFLGLLWINVTCNWFPGPGLPIIDMLYTPLILLVCVWMPRVAVLSINGGFRTTIP